MNPVKERRARAYIAAKSGCIASRVAWPAARLMASLALRALQYILDTLVARIQYFFFWNEEYILDSRHAPRNLNRV